MRGGAIVRERDGHSTRVANRLPRELPARQRQRLVAKSAMNPASAIGVVVVEDAPALNRCKDAAFKTRPRDVAHAGFDRLFDSRCLGRVNFDRPPGRTASPAMPATVAGVKRKNAYS